MTISLTPGSLSGNQLFLNWVCSESGVDVASGRSWELSYAVGNEPGYAWVTDHFEWTFTMAQTTSFTRGPASCWAKALTYDFKAGYTVVATAGFIVQ